LQTGRRDCGHQSSEKRHSQEPNETWQLLWIGYRINQNQRGNAVRSFIQEPEGHKESDTAAHRVPDQGQIAQVVLFDKFGN
jgi:hypothetical protein